MRLFIAIEFDDAVLSHLENIVAALHGAKVSGRYSGRALWHLTLVFIGRTDRSGDVIQIVKQVRAAPFPLAPNGLGCFQRDGGAIVWAGVHAGPALFHMQRQLAAMLTGYGFDVDARPYRPHITLGRQMAIPASLDLSVLSAAFPPQDMTVRSISVMNSERRNGALVYTPVYKQPLSL